MAPTTINVLKKKKKLKKNATNIQVYRLPYLFNFSPCVFFCTKQKNIPLKKTEEYSFIFLILSKNHSNQTWG